MIAASRTSPVQPLSDTHAAFLEWALATPAARDPRNFSDVEGPMPSYHGAFQPWPLFVRSSDADSMSSVVRTLLRAMLQDPAMARDITEDPQAVEAYRLLTERDPLGETVFARGEFVETTGGFRCVEMNISGALASWVFGHVARRILDLEVLKPFFQRVDRELIVKEPALSVLRRVLDQHPGGHVVAMGADDWTPFRLSLAENIINALVARLDRPVPRIHVRRPADFEVRGRELFVSGLHGAVHSVINAQFPEHVSDSVFDAIRAGAARWYCGPAARALCDKRLFARAVEHLETSEQPGAAQARPHLLWTRVISDRIVRFRGHEVEMRDLLTSARNELVVKAGAGYHGQDVYVGRITSGDDWSAAIRAALEDGRSIVQEFAEPVLREALTRSGDVVMSRAIWGSFSSGEENTGLHARVSNTDLVVNTARGAENAVVFMVDE